MTRVHCFCSLGLLMFLLLVVAGCGNGNVGLSGKVTYIDDGSPLTAGTVAFRKDGKIARGRIKEDGAYTVGFEKETDGLPPGKYEVFISGAEKIIGQDKDGENIYEPLIQEKYANASTSGLTLEVTATTKKFDIEVERYTKAKGK